MPDPAPGFRATVQRTQAVPVGTNGPSHCRLGLRTSFFFKQKKKKHPLFLNFGDIQYVKQIEVERQGGSGGVGTLHTERERGSALNGVSGRRLTLWPQAGQSSAVPSRSTLGQGPAGHVSESKLLLHHHLWALAGVRARRCCSVPWQNAHAGWTGAGSAGDSGQVDTRLPGPHGAEVPGRRQPLANLLLRERGGSHVMIRAIKEKLKVKGRT